MNSYPRSINPFIDDYDDDSSSTAGSYYSVETPPEFPPPPPPPAHMSHLKLPAFWPDPPVAWFAGVEAQFKLHQVSSQDEWFCHVTAPLDKLSLKKVVHLVTTPDPWEPYTKLKDALLPSLELTDFMRVELLHVVEPLAIGAPRRHVGAVAGRPALQHLCCPVPAGPPQGYQSAAHPLGPQ